MKEIVAIAITEDDIRYSVETAVAELEEDEQIHFPDNDTRLEFIEDCVYCVIDKYELYGHDPFLYTPNYNTDVLDTAELYGYLCE